MKAGNKLRAARAAKAIRDYDRIKPHEKIYPESIIDMLTDIMHLCQREKGTFESYLETARNHYEAEK